MKRWHFVLILGLIKLLSLKWWKWYTAWKISDSHQSLSWWSWFRSSYQRCSFKKGVLKNFTKLTGKHLCQCLFFNKVAGACNFIKKETLAQVFSCQFCEIFKNTFFKRTPLVAASEPWPSAKWLVAIGYFSCSVSFSSF